MNIDDLFDTVFTVNNNNGNRLRRKKKEEAGGEKRNDTKSSVQFTSVCFRCILNDEKISPDASTMLTID
jgi:hypothetical protein